MNKDSSGYYKFSNLEQVNALASENKLNLMTFDGFVLDPTTFAPHHPGGSEIIANFKGKDITAEMQDHHPRSLQLAQSMVVGSFGKEINSLLDPRKPLASQIWSLSQEDYIKVV
jgi:cytochrome b involved in lipid metabolism